MLCFVVGERGLISFWLVNPADIMGTVDCTRSTRDCWIECFRIVDTVLTKVIQVQRLHMNLMCEFVEFSGESSETL